MGTSIVKNELYPYIKEAFSSKPNRSKLLNYMLGYFDKNSEILSANGPYKQLFFKENDKNYPFIFIKYDMNKILPIIEKVPKIKTMPWKILKEFRFWVLCLIIKYWVDEVKKEDEIDVLLMYLACFYYSSIYYRQWKFGVNENIMAYTINNLSNRFYIKKYGTIYKAVLETIRASHYNLIKKIKRAEDYDIKDYIISSRTAISSFLVNLSSEYYKNEEKKNYINYEKDVSGEDELYEVDNVSFQIETKAQSASLYFISSKYDDSIIKLVSTLTSLSPNVIKSAIIDISQSNDLRIKKIMSLIIDIFLLEENTLAEIPSKKFVAVLLQTYSSSNVKNKSVLELKDLLDDLLKENSPKFLKTNRVATKSSFKKALFLYFVFTIQQTYHMK